jgi:hypothetical protein
MAFVSLVVPFELLALGSGYWGVVWTLLEADYSPNYGWYTHNLSRFTQVDEAASVLLLLLVVTGGVLLLVLKRNPKLGASFLLGGLLTFLIVLVYDEFSYGPYYPIPIGFFLVVAATVIGFRVSVPATVPTPSIGIAGTTDKLIKMKALLDSGVITKEEFEEQKRRLLQGSS